MKIEIDTENGMLVIDERPFVPAVLAALYDLVQRSPDRKLHVTVGLNVQDCLAFVEEKSA